MKEHLPPAFTFATPIVQGVKEHLPPAFTFATPIAYFVSHLWTHFWTVFPIMCGEWTGRGLDVIVISERNFEATE